MKGGTSCVWMIGTSPGGKGGIASVIDQYRAAGLFDGGAVHFEPTHHDRNMWGRLLPFLRCMVKLWGALTLGRVQLVHAHIAQGFSFWRKSVLVLPAIVLNVPVIFHLHGCLFMEFYAEGGWWRRRWVRYLFRRSFRVIALSVEWKQWVLGVEPDAKVEVVFNSLARNTGAGPRTSFDRKPTVLFLGRIGQRKGTFDLLRAFAAVKAAVPEARLVVGGDGDAERLLAEAEALCVRDAVTYVGWVEGDAKSRLMAECRVLALPSYHEGLPMAILEAMAFSRAVVSCPVGGISQAVTDGETGFLVQPGDVSTLAHRLITILSGPHAAAQMGRAGRRVFEEKFSHEGALPKVLSLYRQAGVARMPRLAAGSEDVS